MLRHTLVFFAVFSWATVIGCTNDYEDFAYVSEGGNATSGGQPNDCNFNRDCDADEECVDGRCSCEGGPACGAGATCCAPEGCVDLDNDPNHCGGCNNDCPMGMTCTNRSCMP